MFDDVSPSRTARSIALGQIQLRQRGLAVHLEKQKESGRKRGAIPGTGRSGCLKITLVTYVPWVGIHPAPAGSFTNVISA